MSERCDDDIFQRGKPLVAVSTGPVGGAQIFEQWCLKQSAAMKADPACKAAHLDRVIDWHYSGGIAQVLVHPDADFEAVRKFFGKAGFRGKLPAGMSIIRWLSDTAGLYRAGVTPMPDEANGGFVDPDTGSTAFI